MTRTRSLVICIVTLGCLAASAAAAQACDTWHGGSGAWGTNPGETSTNWSTGKVPNNTEAACITEPGTYTVTLSATGGEAKSLTVGGTSGVQSVDVVGTSYVYNGETQRVTSLRVGSASFAANTRLTLDATAGGTSAAEELGANAYLVGGTIEEFGQVETVVTDPKWEDFVKASNLIIEPGATVQVASGTLRFQQEGEGAYPWSASNEGTITVDSGASVAMNPSFAGSAAFTNDGAIVNDGSITGNATNWDQSGGSISGNEVVLQNAASLADSAGTGKFLLNSGSGKVTGTIPAGQTVTVQGEPFDSGGEIYNSTALSLDGAELVNDGTIALDASGSGEASGGSVTVEAGSIQNNGQIVAEVLNPSRVIHLQAGLTNGHAGTLTLTGGSFDQDSGTATTNDGLVTIGPGAVYLLQEGSSFANESDGTVAPQIASASSFGAFQLTSPCCNGPGTFTAAGTLTPVLLGGFVPTAGQEFQIFALQGGRLTGTFAAVAGGFSADYSHESYETPSPNYVGLVYGALPPPVTPREHRPPRRRPGPHRTHRGDVSVLAHVVSIASAHGKLVVKLSCQAGAACAAVTVKVTVTEHLKHGKVTAVTARKAKKKAGAKTKRVVIATASATLAAGTAKTLKLAPNAAGRALLAKHHKLRAVVTVSSSAKTLKTATVSLQKAAPRRKK